MKFEWEKIHRREQAGEWLGVTFRAKVHGGWLVKHSMVSTYQENITFGYTVNDAMLFVPDPKHEWDISE